MVSRLVAAVCGHRASFNAHERGKLPLSSESLGLRLEENLDPAAIEARYFQGRSDRYHAIEHIHFAKAAVV